MTYQIPMTSDFFVYRGCVYRVVHSPRGQMPQGLDYSVQPPNEELRQRLISAYHENLQADVTSRTVNILYFTDDPPHGV
jgi:hypothetical protein